MPYSRASGVIRAAIFETFGWALEAYLGAYLRYTPRMPATTITRQAPTCRMLVSKTLCKGAVMSAMSCTATWQEEIEGAARHGSDELRLKTVQGAVMNAMSCTTWKERAEGTACHAN